MQLVILPAYQWAGHCTSGTSNKVWAACLAYARDEEDQTPLITPSDSTEVFFLSVYGRFGAALQQSAPQRLSFKVAHARFGARRQEKAGKGYASVSFASYLPAFGSPLGMALILTSSTAGSTPLPARIPEQQVEETASCRYTAALLKAIPYTGLLARLEGEDSLYGVSEKVDGERCLVEFDGTHLRAYNRKGKAVSLPPDGAQALRRLGSSFVVDGERLTREHAGEYVVFDVLEQDGQNQLALPYRSRMTQLVRNMHRAGLLLHTHLTPTLREARGASAVAGLSVLLVVRGARAQTAIQSIQTAGGEGVVLRRLDALYAEGGFKYKFLQDLDAFVIGVEPGVSAGSLTLALLRPSDGAVIEIGHVRSGLTDADVRQVQTMLVQGQHPVFRVSYLPASTIGITLVQPRTSMTLLRADKAASECTTDQFGPEKAAHIERAQPVIGVRVH
jgi:hypothetical protein